MPLFRPSSPWIIQYNPAKAMNVNNTTGNISLFRIAGCIEARRIWGVVTTALSSNITAAYLRLTTGSNNVDVTLATGVTLSSLPTNSLIYRRSLASVALQARDATTLNIGDPNSSGNDSICTSIALIKESAATTDLVIRYTTTNAPSSGNIDWYMEWMPLSKGASVTNL